MSEDKKRIYKPRPISGFPEWLPEVRAVEQQWFDHIRRVFESYGFCNIETPSVEELDAINAKGGDGGADVDKEVYELKRHLSELSYEIIHKDVVVPEHYTLININDPKFPDHKLYETGKEARLALHFDQTVPLARYTAQHFNDLVFPFKRYQMQRVWRGERPQAGRFREFYQCDIDVINVDNLPLHFDAEMPAIIWEILSSLPGMEHEKIQIRISNRKILTGFLESLSIKDYSAILREVDKVGKKSEQEIAKIIIGYIIASDGSYSFEQANAICDQLFNIVKTKGLSPEIRAIKSLNEKMEEGIEELSFVLNQLSHLPEDSVVADLSIVRGLDYYTGTVYETVFLDDPSYGSICSGGRYDDLASNYINKHLPGVGISIGFSRLFDRLRQQGKLPLKGISPAQFLITLEDESLRPRMMETAQKLRALGHNVETYHSPSKFKKQLEYAMKKGIRYVWLLPYEGRTADEVKDMVERTQTATKTEDWKK